MKQLLITAILLFGFYSCGKDSGEDGRTDLIVAAPQVPEEETIRPVPTTISQTFKCFFAEPKGQYGLKSLIKKSQTSLSYSECGDDTGLCRSAIKLAYQNTETQKCVTKQDHPEDFQICVAPKAPTIDTPEGRLVKAEFAELDTVTELWCEEGIKAFF